MKKKLYTPRLTIE